MQWKNVAARAWAIFQTHFLPIAFVIAVLVAMLAPAPGKAVVSVEAGPFNLIQMLNIIIVFFISGLTLDTKEIGRALKNWPGVVWGFVTILLVTPCLGFALKAIPFTPPEFAAGLAIFSAAPTTLGVGAALVRQSKGNDALALFLLTGTNLIAVFTLPLWLKALVGSGTASDGSTYSLNFSLGQMIWQLLVTVLAPALVGKALRDLVPAVARFAKKYKTYLSMFSVANLAFIVWQSLSAAQSVLVAQKFVNILYVIIAAVLQHLIYLIFNGLVAHYVFHMPVEEGIAVTIMGGQKSAPVAITAITFLTQVVSTQGLLSVPCIVGQLVQIFMGAAYAPWLAKKVTRIKNARKAKEEEAAAAEAVSEAADLAENGEAGDVLQNGNDKGVAGSDKNDSDSVPESDAEKITKSSKSLAASEGGASVVKETS